MIGLALIPGTARSQAWWPDGAVYAADFANGRYMRNGVHIPPSAAFTLTRASEKLAQTASGEWRLFGPDVPAITDLGLFCEPEETFYPVNALFEGAVPGLIGAGGALPTNWTVLVSGGLSIEVVHTGLHGDAPYIRLRIFGTTTGTDFQIALNAYTQAATAGETWTAALSLRHVAGGVTGLTAYVRVVEEASGTFVGATSDRLMLGSKVQYGMATRTVLSGSTSNVRARFQMAMAGAGLPVDLSMDMLVPTLAKNSMPGTPMLTSVAVVALRAPDATTLLLPSGSRTLTVNHGDGSTMATGVGSDYPLPSGLAQPLRSAVLM